MPANSNPQTNIVLQNIPGNLLEQVEILRQQMTELKTAPYIDPPEGVAVDDLRLWPDEGVEVTDPTSTDYTGGFACGEGLDFGGITYTFGYVKLGVIQWGGRKTDAAYVAGAGGVVLDESGATINGLGVLFKFTNGSSFGFFEIIPLGGVFMGLLAGVSAKTVLDSDFNSGAFGGGWNVYAGTPTFSAFNPYPGSSYSMLLNANSEGIVSDYITVSAGNQHFLDFYVYDTTSRVLNFLIEYFDAGSASLGTESFQINYQGLASSLHLVYLFDGEAPLTATKAKIRINTIGTGGTNSIFLQKISLYQCSGIMIRNGTLVGPLTFTDNTIFLGNIAVTGTVSGSNLSGTNTGDGTLAAVGAVPNANGLTLTGQVLNGQPADATHPGMVTELAQIFGGAKTFNDAVVASSGLRAPDTNIRSSASTFNSLADDVVYSFTPTSTRGLIILGGISANIFGIAMYNTPTPTTIGHSLGSSTVVTTGILTNGTTDGTDGKFNISCHTDGKVYLKNRIGTTQNFFYLVV